MKRVRKMSSWVVVGLSLGIATLVVGCGSGEKNTDDKGGTELTDAQIQEIAKPFLLSEEPKKPMDVIGARKTTKDKDKIVLVGKIGGSTNPWIKGQAAFTVADESLKSCSDSGCKCPTPWDYCCETADTIKAASVLVSFFDANGKRIKIDAKKLFQLKELQTVVIRGKVDRDDTGKFAIIATGLFVRKAKTVAPKEKGDS